jgi:hypothetical protein
MADPECVPPGMVRVVRPRSRGLASSATRRLLDRPVETTNRQFGRGGSRLPPPRPAEPFVELAAPCLAKEAVERFRDGTGRPGPVTWRSGTSRGQRGFLCRRSW